MRVFDPWVGANYKKEGIDGVRILILGESHYGEAGTESREFTSEVVRMWGQDSRSRFFTVIQNLVEGREPGIWVSDEERKAFWDHVAFYNFIQEFVGSEPRQRPTADMWTDASGPLVETIEELDPNVLIVLGYELNEHLPELPRELIVCSIKHPSARGFNYVDWRPMIQEALGVAAENTPNKAMESDA